MSIKNIDGIEKQNLKDFAEKAYLDYAMSVILDRALPYIGDGLKPVQRRIIYSMSELKLNHLSKPKKSARTVGDVLGKYHPHGDNACYEAMVLMAQPFSYRYPFILGQGNWGSSDDPKSFAAMRYTEAKLTKYSEVLLNELDQGTVEWVPNFDGTLKEPKTLPARLPNILLNGTTGIAVGMATDIPPHNLTEIADACVHLIENPKAKIEDLLKFINGPDFPTEAEIITPKEDLLKIYSAGAGSIKARAVYEVEKNGDIVITALPYLVSGAKILEQIAAMMQNKKLSQVADLKDESDHENPTRLVIVPKSKKINTDELMLHLFATTDLERFYKVNLNIIGLDGRPAVKNLLTLLKEWLEFRKIIVKKRLEFRLEKVTSRLHLLEGFLIAFLNIEEIIAIIRREDKPKPVLMSLFGLSEKQAEAILDIKLRNLAKLEEQKIKAEQKELEKERKNLTALLASDRKLKTLIKKEILHDKKLYQDKRLSPIVTRIEAKAIDMSEKIPVEPMTVILSKKGWVRAGKGHEIDLENLNYKSGDEYQAHTLAKNTDLAIFLDNNGRSYSLSIRTLPSIRGYGEPLTSKLSPESGASFISVVNSTNLKDQYLLASNTGYGFVTNIESLITKNKKGKVIVTLSQNAILLPLQKINDFKKDFVALISSEGKLLTFPIKEIPLLNKGKGKKLFGITTTAFQAKTLSIVAMKVLTAKDNLTIVSGKRKKIIDNKELLSYYRGKPGQKGLKLPRGFQNITSVF